jgi:spore maturation protein A
MNVKRAFYAQKRFSKVRINSIPFQVNEKLIFLFLMNPSDQDSPVFRRLRQLMLNVIWLALIFIGTLVAMGQDLYDLAVNRYQNGREAKVSLQMNSPLDRLDKASSPYPCTIVINPQAYATASDQPLQKTNPLRQKAELYILGKDKGRLHIFVDDDTPPLWKEIYKLQKNAAFLQAHIRWQEGTSPLDSAYLSFDPIRFNKIQAITNDGLIQYAKVAVELAIGLIGIMALWLGLMKIAEQAGLIAHLAKALKGITRRLFPDVPPDHPAMGAMIMNISANMLGLGNAATPLGLKAMEELNKLNKKPGVATDAMCTFLVINTSNVQLIPATVIAIRAAAGSTHPTEILGPVILATTINTIVGIMVVKFLAKWRLFKKQLETEEE